MNFFYSNNYCNQFFTQVLTILSFGPLILLLTGQESMNKLNLKFLNFIEPENLLFYLTVIASLLFVTSNLSNILVSKITLNLGQKMVST